MLRNLRDAISYGGGEEKYRQLVGRRTAVTVVSYMEGVLTYRQVAGWYSVFRPKISKSTRVTGFPSR